MCSESLGRLLENATFREELLNFKYVSLPSIIQILHLLLFLSAFLPHVPDYTLFLPSFLPLPPPLSLSLSLSLSLISTDSESCVVSEEHRTGLMPILLRSVG